MKNFLLHDNLIQWQNQCLESESFCIPEKTNATDPKTVLPHADFRCPRVSSLYQEHYSKLSRFSSHLYSTEM